MDNLIDFSKTTFYKGLNTTYGKVPVKLELCLNFEEDFNLGIYIGIDPLYKITDIGHFIEAVEKEKSLHLSKNFIFQPKEMFFDHVGKNVVEYLKRLNFYRDMKHSEGVFTNNIKGSVITLNEEELNLFLDSLWEHREELKFHKSSSKYSFLEKIDIGITMEKEEGLGILTFNYSMYGDFIPLSVDYKYIFFKDNNLIIKTDKTMREIFSNIYRFKNSSNIVSFKIDMRDKKIFKRNFYDRFCKELNICIDKEIREEIEKSGLVSKVYFDISPVGIVSMIEFCYDKNVINPLKDNDGDKSIREFD